MTKLPEGQMTAGDIFQKSGEERAFVQSFLAEGADLFVNLFIFNHDGFVRTDCINIISVYEWDFVDNIMEVK